MNRVLGRLVIGDIYTLQTLIPPQRLMRQHCMTYMGNDGQGHLLFNARPFAGTQQIHPETIKSISWVAHGGRDSDRHYMNRIVR